jgi:hypothetical protein
MRKLAVLGTFAVVAAGGGLLLAGRTTRAQQTTPAVPDSVAAVALAAGDTASLPGPRQPIFFRHDIHAGQYKIDCQYCHYSVTVSSEPGIPSVQTCMGCHTAIAGTDSSARREIRKLRTFWNNREQADSSKLEWTRIHTLARHVRFPHSVHVKAMGPKACGTCHGDVARMPQVFETNNVNNMGFCISCHLQRNVKRDCSVCHY